jgi:DeoR family glycerol-3-phosphate regulon repressor
MLTARQNHILKKLESQGSCSVSALASDFGVSLETVRRDLKQLTDNGSVVRVHGAVGLAGQMGEAPFQRRMRENSTEKQMIARHVSASVRDGDSVMMDTGTTTSFIARELLNHRRLSVVTNSSDIARTLATVNGNKVYMAGGQLRADSAAAFGQSAVDFVRQFTVEHAIISAGAVNENGIMDYDLEEAEFARTVLSMGTRKIVVTDHTKFGRRGLVQVTGFEEITDFITDKKPPDDIFAALVASGARLGIAGSL